ncbi:MAG: hypothetical protein QNK05_10920 [Myxococcota bacterium]|nr:hypothetical protein [Myxococcota bacterium]
MRSLLLTAAALVLLAAPAQAYVSHGSHGRHASFGHAGHGHATGVHHRSFGHRGLHRGAVVTTRRGSVVVIPRSGRFGHADRRFSKHHGSRFERRHFGSYGRYGKFGRFDRYGHRGFSRGRH